MVTEEERLWIQTSCRSGEGWTPSAIPVKTTHTYICMLTVFKIISNFKVNATEI